MNRLVLVTLLGAHGYHMIEAPDGAAALIAARTHHPDLVITDVLMPVLDGYGLVKQLRLDEATSRIPVVFYTAHYDGREARALALSSGVACVLAKPADSAEVLAVVARALAGDAEPGTASVGNFLPTAFDRDHLQLLTDAVSDKADGLRAVNARLRAFIDLGLELASERDGERLIDNVCTAARTLFGATYVTLGLVDRADRTLSRVVTRGIGVSNWIAAGAAVPGILGAVVTERRLRRGTNPGGEPAALQLPALHPRIQAYLAAPIASPAQVYGWICLVRNDGVSFGEDDQDLATALSGLVGRVYENGYFAGVARARADELEREIVERKLADLALRRERDQSQQYLDTADVILLALDLEGRITLINRKGTELLGWSEQELLGRDWVTTCLPERVRAALIKRLRGVTGGDLAPVENPVLTKSGEERLIEWRNSLLRDDAGNIVGTLSSGADITQQYQAAEARRQAEERTRFALEAARVGIWDMDYGTGVLRWSDILEGQYGLPPGTFAGTFEAYIEQVYPDDRPLLMETLQRAKETGSDFWLQNRALWSDGSVRWLTGVGRVQLDSRGAAVRSVGISLDVTERRELEAQFQQAQKMEAVGRLAGGVAHDFNNLLAVILGNSELLLADLDRADPHRADVEAIQRASTSAAGLTRQLLAFSRKQIIEPTLFDLNVLMAEMHGMIARLIREDVTVVFALTPEPSPIKADRGQVEQILMNLTANARDAICGVGRLTIETANIEIGRNDLMPYSGALPGWYVVLTVTDTGAGIPPDVQARLFEPYFTTKDPGKGTGLGLATVHGIVTASGGGITVESAVGRGTTFRVYFAKAEGVPVNDRLPVIEVPSPPPAPSPSRVTRTVLVVDDMEGLRSLAKRVLLQLGYSVLTAANADEAVFVFETHASIDAVLTDVVMPGASGPELVEKLRAIRPELKAIYMSGYTEDAIIRNGAMFKTGIAFIQKPFTADGLKRKIREVLGPEPPVQHIR